MNWRPTAPLLPHQAPADFAALAANPNFFDPQSPLVFARAPGRLDLMGGIADYSGSLVLELPLAVAASAFAQLIPEPIIQIRSLQADSIDASPEVSITLAELIPDGRPLSYAAANALLGANPANAWAAYIAGVLVVLGNERGLKVTQGVRLLLDSQVPPGKGVSSSAAIEVATMRAVATLFQLELSGRELAILCQMVENLVVGAPCGVMDQMTSACGEQDALLALRCQPAELEPAVELPQGLQIWGIDSGIRHAVSGADYGSVRIGAFMGYRIIADLLGLPVSSSDSGRVQIEDSRWGGYLANISPAEWEQGLAQQVPVSMEGAAFLERYGGTTDSVTKVDPARSYAVRQPTAHPIYEHQRVRLFRSLLRGGAADTESRSLLGELMYLSHVSYSLCGLGSGGTDRLVDLVRAQGPAAGLYGAKITGGGSGGTVAVLASDQAAAAIQAVAEAYSQETGRPTTLLHGSSPGAQAFGPIWLEHG